MYRAHGAVIFAVAQLSCQLTSNHASTPICKRCTSKKLFGFAQHQHSAPSKPQLSDAGSTRLPLPCTKARLVAHVLKFRCGPPRTF